MLTADQIDVLRDRSGQLLDPVVDFLVEDIAKRVSEAGQLTGTAAYEVWRAQNLGLSQKKLKKELQKRLDLSLSEVEDLLTQAAETGYNFDLSRLPTSHAIPFAENTSLQQVVNAAVQLAKEDLTNLTQTMGFVGSDGKVREITKAYQQACDFAFEKVFTGAQDYTSAIRDATKGLAEKGIRFIDYESGVHTSMEAAVRRNIMGGLGIMQNQISRQNHDDLGCDGWEISAHHGSAPDHEPYQGKQYPDAEYQRLNGSLVRPIGELNCGHSAFPIILGVNSPQYTPEELEAMRQENEEGVTFDGKHYTLYEATQRQRKFEKSIRDRKRRILIDETVGDKDKLQTDQIRLQVLKQEYARFSKGVGLPMQHSRMETAGFDWKKGKAAGAGADRIHKEWLSSIGAQNTRLNTLDKYLEAKYNDSPEYRLLTGYDNAVTKGDISPLVGFELYKSTSNNIKAKIVGQKTATGVEIQSFATHFIDRIIGQTSESHPGMRCGVSITDALDALQNPVKIGPVRTLPDGDVRQTFTGKNAKVTISVRDSRLIQTNPY